MSEISQEQAKKAVDSLRKTSQLLFEHGWIQGTEKNWKGQMCLIGALKAANGPGQELATQIIMRCIGTSIPTWNDQNDRVFNDVVTLLKASENIALELAE